jgi:hypothetical protein
LADLLLAYDTLKDPRDMAEVIHLAAGFGGEVELIGKSIDARHPKVLRKLRSWRPRLAERRGGIDLHRFAGVREWAEAARARGFVLAATVVEGGMPAWSDVAAGARVAVLFGEETRGLRREAIELCDVSWTLPLGEGSSFYTVGQATALVLGGLDGARQRSARPSAGT